MPKSYLNWSSGKDAAMAFFELQKEGNYKIERLVTTVNSEYDRISMHNVRQELLLQQAHCLQIPLTLIPLKGNVSLEEYNKVMDAAINELKDENFTHSIFGDIFLEDLRKYREDQLAQRGIHSVFPLWKKDTSHLIREFIETGFKAITVCVNANFLDSSYCGRMIDLDFINSLPRGLDPCGENGEFHTFVFDGPIFREPVKFRIGEIVQEIYSQTSEGTDTKEEQTWNKSFWYCDLLPK